MVDHIYYVAFICLSSFSFTKISSEAFKKNLNMYHKLSFFIQFKFDNLPATRGNVAVSKVLQTESCGFFLLFMSVFTFHLLHVNIQAGGNHLSVQMESNPLTLSAHVYFSKELI